MPLGAKGKGGQAWLTYHLSPREMVQTSFRHAKVADDFIPSGTTQNSFDIRVVKRVREYLEISAEVQHEWWKAPVYQPGEQTDTVARFQLTLYPERKTAPVRSYSGVSLSDFCLAGAKRAHTST